MTTAFQSNAFQGDGFQVGGIGLADEAGIGLAPPAPVDFVIQPRPWTHEVAQFRDTLQARNVVGMAVARAARREREELREMVELYGAWRRAA